MTDTLNHSIATLNNLLNEWAIEGSLAPLLRAVPEATRFDMQKDSRVLGRGTGDLIAMDPSKNLDEAIRFLSNFAGYDPFFDPIAIVMARRTCPQFRRFLADNDVAREFERLFSQHAIDRLLEIRHERETAN
jgi:hypothetical protein